MSGEFRYVPGSPIVDLAGVNALLTDWFNQTYPNRLGTVTCSLEELTGLQAYVVSIALALPLVPQTETSDNSLLLWCEERIREEMPEDPTTPYLVRVSPVVEVATMTGLEYQRLRMLVYVVKRPEEGQV